MLGPMSTADRSPHATSATFSDRLASAVDAVGVPACVGLDPVYERLPAELRCGTGSAGTGPGGDGAVGAIGRFCVGVLDSVAGVVPAVKLQAACFERFGGAGFGLLLELVAHARRLGLVTVLDAKRGDIGVSAEHYAAAAFGHAPDSGADSLTVNAYLGPDTVEPYLKHAAQRAGSGGGAQGAAAGHTVDTGGARSSRGLFVLVRTSNPGSDAVQSLRLADGRTVAEMMADHVAALGAAHVGRRGLSDVGAVVAATKPADAAALRRRMPRAIFLVPGYGAQGGTADDIRGLVRPEWAATKRPGDAGVLVTASRSVIYPAGEAFNTGDWRGAVNAAAKAFARELQAVVA